MAPAIQRALGAALSLGVAAGVAVGESSASSANPIRRVVSMLQMMQEKVTAEGKKEKDLFEKYMCYCTQGTSDLSASISSAETKISQDTSGLEAAEASKVQLEDELSKHKSDRSDAKDAVASAKAMREKEAQVYAKDSSDHKTNIAALGKAIDALEKGATGFLQTSAALRLKQLTIDMDLSSADRDMLSSFLSTGSSNGYVPQSGAITGILKQMKDTMEKDLSDITATENAAIADFEALVAAKTKEIEAHGAAIESKTERSGKVGLEIVALKESLDDTSKALLDDKKFLNDLDQNCATKKQEWEQRSSTRADELLALADTIKLLNDDDALELFKSTLPSPSLLQTKVSDSATRRRALEMLKTSRSNANGKSADPRMDLVMLALSGKGKSFDKVLKMIDDMVTLLGKEQGDDDEKKAYCESSLDKAEDEKKVLDQSVADLEKSMEDAKESIATLSEELAALAAGIKALDKSVADATETRKAENAEYKETMAADQAAKELIGVAKNRLNKFYNVKMYKAPPKRELSAEDRIFVNNGGTAPPTEAPGGIAGTGIDAAPVLAQVSAHTFAAGRVAPPPAPETWDVYAKKGQESNGVIAMLDMLVADLDKEMQEMDVNEKEGQREYEGFMEDSKTKRAADAKLMADKESYKAELEIELQQASVEHKSTVKKGMGKAEEIRDFHLECDWLMANHAARKEARAGEVESLKSAKAVLSGADYALLQEAPASSRRMLRGSA